MIEWQISPTAGFTAWIDALRDENAQALISRRIDRIAEGNLGDVESVGEGVSEIRVNYGPGYRIYFTRRGNVLIVLLCGGDKGSQTRDIKKAKALARGIP